MFPIGWGCISSGSIWHDGFQEMHWVLWSNSWRSNFPESLWAENLRCSWPQGTSLASAWPPTLCHCVWLEPPGSQLGSESLKEHSCAHDLLLVMEALLSTRSSHWTVLLCLEKLLQKVLSFSSGPSSWQTDADTDHVVSKSARSQWRGHNWGECSFQSSQHPHTHTLIANILLPKFPRPPWRFVLWALDACDKKSKSVTESNNFSCGFQNFHLLGKMCKDLNFFSANNVASI